MTDTCTFYYTIWSTSYTITIKFLKGDTCNIFLDHKSVENIVLVRYLKKKNLCWLGILMPSWTEVKWRKIWSLRFLTSENNGTLIWIKQVKTPSFMPCQQKRPFFMQCGKCGAMW